MPAVVVAEAAEQNMERRQSPYVQRGRYYDPGYAFAIKYPPVPKRVFLAERDLAFASDTPTGLIALDQSDAMGLEFPATTPLVLARYARIRAGESLSTAFRATGEIAYAIQGRVRTEGAGERIEWRTGDTVFLPGGGEWTHRAEEDTVLWIVTDEPQLAFMRAEAPLTDGRLGKPVHFLAEDLDRQLGALYQREDTASLPGLSIVYSSDAMERIRNVHPAMTLAMNSLPPGGSQRPHHHNSVAVTLCVQG